MAETILEVVDELREAIKTYAPQLLAEFEDVTGGRRRVTELGDWLDQNFPRDGGWGHLSIIDTPRILRSQLEAAQKNG